MSEDWNIVYFHKPETNDPIVESVRELLLSRSRVGILKYGKTLADNPLSLREWLVHALEECLDQAVYLRRAIAEMDAEQDDGN